MGSEFRKYVRLCRKPRAGTGGRLQGPSLAELICGAPRYTSGQLERRRTKPARVSGLRVALPRVSSQVRPSLSATLTTCPGALQKIDRRDCAHSLGKAMMPLLRKVGSAISSSRLQWQKPRFYKLDGEVSQALHSVTSSSRLALVRRMSQNHKSTSGCTLDTVSEQITPTTAVPIAVLSTATPASQRTPQKSRRIAAVMARPGAAACREKRPVTTA